MKLHVWNELSLKERDAVLRRSREHARPEIARSVRSIVAKVRRDGDAAVRALTERFDGVALRSLRVTEAELSQAEALLGKADKAALRVAYRNIRAFHAAQRTAPLRVETQRGIVCEKVTRPIERVGLYVPGGSAPLPSTVLMLGVPSQLAGCEVRVICTPPDRKGQIHPWILYAAKLTGITEIYKIGGAQAIAALAYGTATVPKCEKIFGPGNAFVTEAKQQVAEDADGAALDLPAGPSEVMVIADRRANPVYVAADLLSQAEHGPDSHVVLVSLSRPLALRVQVELQTQLASLPRAAIARRALLRSPILLANGRAQAIEIANRYGPEHLLLEVEKPRELLGSVRTAGSVFLGDLTPESLGDYASGTNHVLPTYGWARKCSGLGLSDFQRTMTVQSATEEGLKRLGPVVERLALAEGLHGHQRAVRVRLDRSQK